MNDTRPLRILYAALLSPNDSAQYRAWALERLGHTILPVNAYEYEPSNPTLRKILFRAQTGPWVWRLNQDILRIAKEQKPDLFWCDKLLSLQPETIEALRAMGVPTVSYMIDNAFGPRRDPGWRLYRKDIPHFDLHATQRDANVEDYRRAGARDVIKIQTAYEPTIHFAPPAGWSDADRPRDVSFIGTPYDDRAQILTALAKEFGFDVTIEGGLVWRKPLAEAGGLDLYKSNGEVYGKQYREGIWRSKINLSFLTHSNQDEFVHKSFEIAACGGFLLAERSAGHLARFREDEEAVFFTGMDELVAKIERYLPDEAARARIAAAGHARAISSGYSNDHQVAAILERIRPLVGV